MQRRQFLLSLAAVGSSLSVAKSVPIPKAKNPDKLSVDVLVGRWEYSRCSGRFVDTIVFAKDGTYCYDPKVSVWVKDNGQTIQREFFGTYSVDDDGLLVLIESCIDFRFNPPPKPATYRLRLDLSKWPDLDGRIERTNNIVRLSKCK